MGPKRNVESPQNHLLFPKAVTAAMSTPNQQTAMPIAPTAIMIVIIIGLDIADSICIPFCITLSTVVHLLLRLVSCFGEVSLKLLEITPLFIFIEVYLNRVS
jgi:hypothetical protein